NGECGISVERRGIEERGKEIRSRVGFYSVRCEERENGREIQRLWHATEWGEMCGGRSCCGVREERQWWRRSARRRYRRHAASLVCGWRWREEGSRVEEKKETRMVMKKIRGGDGGWFLPLMSTEMETGEKGKNEREKGDLWRSA
ncbi:hypothetical protein HAX54_023725, partial [Datura stramonium]|nr:hypothetical protein [Datura stramonium]